RKPQLVYDRFFLRQEPGAGRRLALYRRFKGRGGFQFLNPHLPDKWTVYRMLKDAGHLDEHLPPTVPYRGAGGLIKRLDQWGGVVVKPVRGQKGLGLWFMRPGGGGRIRIRSGTEKSRTVSRRGLAGWCAGKIRRNGHLVQKLLALRDPGRRPRDVRVIVQRDGEGRIGVTGMAVRVGRRGTLLANLHRGGYAARVEEVLEGIRPPKDALLSGVGGDDAGPAGFDAGTGSSAEICLAAVARAVFQVLDDAMGSFAELGIDLGVDAAGCIWFIEANGRPGRSIFREIRAREIRRLSIVHPIAYARRRLLER
ncbi:MAG: YheC/YheD family protein, partial [Thermaerobacterales bacterium]